MRIKNLRDDPMAVSHSVRFKSKIFRMHRYMNNIDKIRGQMAFIEGNLTSAIDIMQRIHEIAIQGANGVYDQSQLAMMGEEVDQLLHELILIGNAKSEDGLSLFSGCSVLGPFLQDSHALLDVRVQDLKFDQDLAHIVRLIIDLQDRRLVLGDVGDHDRLRYV